jgi:hypothetical protein
LLKQHPSGHLAKNLFPKWPHLVHFVILVVNMVLRLVGRSVASFLPNTVPLTRGYTGYWAALAVAYVLPKIIRYTLGVISLTVRKYVEWLKAIRRFVPGT